MIDYAITVMSFGLDVEVRLNDVTTYKNRSGQSINDENFVDEYVASGKNELKLILRPPGGANEPDPSAEGIAELIAVERGDRIDQGEVLAQAVWPDEDTSPAPRSYPQIAVAEETLTTEDYRSWRNAPPVTLDDLTRRDILKLLRQLTEAMTNRQLEDTVNLLKEKVIERAQAYRFRPPEKLGDLRRNYAELMQRPNWGIEPWKDEDAQMEVMGNGKLVKIVDPNGQPLIRSTDLGGMCLAVPIFVTFLNGKWTIIR